LESAEIRAARVEIFQSFQNICREALALPVIAKAALRLAVLSRRPCNQRAGYIAKLNEFTGNSNEGQQNRDQFSPKEAPSPLSPSQSSQISLHGGLTKRQDRHLFIHVVN
jgi:hypothetical protein